MNYFEFMDKHWFIGFLLTAGIVGGAFNLIFLMWNRFWRHMNIRKHGYPPAHCDADGDFKPEPKP
jgi:hypothetical protein